MPNHRDVRETLADLRRQLEGAPCKGRGAKKAIQCIDDAEMWLRFDEAMAGINCPSPPPWVNEQR